MNFCYCTYFDKNYLHKGLALYRSMVHHFPEFTLWILCFDQETWEILARLTLPSVRLIRLDDFERDDEALQEAKRGRTPTEYYWTCTPSLPLYIFGQEPSLGGAVYLDADLFFYHDPAPIFDELGTGSILIHPHRFAPQYADRAKRSGIYNVGMVAFRRDESGLECLHWWRERCNEWCFFRDEDGKLGDQKYLDDWPVRFQGVVVSQHPGVGLAPWNISNYGLTTRNGQVFVDDAPLVFFHFHSFRLSEQGLFWLADYSLAGPQYRLVYTPYVRELNACIAQVRQVAPDFSAGYSPLSLRKCLSLFRRRRLGFRFDGYGGWE